MKKVTAGKMKVVGILGTTGCILAASKTAQELLNRVGMNTGNLLYHYAVNRLVKNPKVFIDWRCQKELELYKDVIEVLVIPAANQLNPAWNNEWLTKVIEFLDKPIVIVGLGAQWDTIGKSNIELSEGTIRLLHLIRERAILVGLRGEQSQEFVNKYGVVNTVVTGCPSNFINQKISGASIAQLIFNFSKNNSPKISYLKGTFQDYTLRSEKHIFSIVRPFIHDFVCQTNYKLLPYLMSRVGESEFYDYMRFEFDALNTDLSFEKYIEQAMVKSRYYFSAAEWLNYAEKTDLHIGHRIHGAIAGIQGGGLGVCVAFDGRTTELVGSMGYPYLNSTEIFKFKDIHDAVRNVIFDQEDFDLKRKKLAESLHNCFQVEDIQLDLKLC